MLLDQQLKYNIVVFQLSAYTHAHPSQHRFGQTRVKQQKQQQQQQQQQQKTNKNRNNRNNNTNNKEAIPIATSS